MLDLSIIIPCLNEEKTIGSCVTEAQSFLQQSAIKGEVLVIDNGSHDHSVSVAQAAGATVIHESERGYGSALLAGLARAQGRYTIMGDGDLSYNFLELAPFVEKLRAGFDLVMGNRFSGAIEVGAMPWLHRYVGNPLLSGFGRCFFCPQIRDFHCGLRGFNTEAMRKAGLVTLGMEFATEMVVKAALLGFKITEVPITLRRDGRGRKSHLRTWRDGWRHLRFMILYAPQWVFWYPGLLLLTLGVAISTWLIPAQRYVFDVHTLLYAASFYLAGLSALLCGLIAEAYAAKVGLVTASSRLRRWTTLFSLEYGLFLGGALLLFGIGGTLYALAQWMEVSFGDLQPGIMLRIAIPSVTLCVAGLQIIFASFVLGILSISSSLGPLLQRRSPK